MSEQDQNSPEHIQDSEERNISEENHGEQKLPESGELNSGEATSSPAESARGETPGELFSAALNEGQPAVAKEEEAVLPGNDVQPEEDVTGSVGGNIIQEEIPPVVDDGEHAAAEQAGEPVHSHEITSASEEDKHGATAEVSEEVSPGMLDEAELATGEAKGTSLADESSLVNDDVINNGRVEETMAEPESAESPLDGLAEIVAGEEDAAAEEAGFREEVVDELAHIIEAIVFASDEPLPAATIKSVLDAAHTFGRVNPDMITARIGALNAKYEADGSGFHILEIANGYQFATRKEMAQWVSNLFKERAKRRLSNSALETLAIIAYKQPITKPEVESIRGVNVDYILHSLLEKEIVTVVGRADSVGRPLLYGTTQKFLKIFALKSLEDLPKLREIDEIIREIKSKGAEESIQLEITALGDSSATEPTTEPDVKPEVSSGNGTE